jgi:hypothetical protein
VNHPYLACNRGNPLEESHPTQHAPIRAGTNITAYYVPPNCPPGFNQPTENLYPEFLDPTTPTRCEGSEHPWFHAFGPLLVYMANCNGPCDQFEPEGKKVWFKIYESGLKNGGQETPWGTKIDLATSTAWDQMSLPNKGWNVTIPKNLKPGNYLIRHEIIMIELMPPQFYPECAHLTVSGDGDKVPGKEYLVSFPGAYSLDGMSPPTCRSCKGMMLMITPDPGLAVCGDLYSPRGHTIYVSLIHLSSRVQVCLAESGRTIPFRVRGCGLVRIRTRIFWSTWARYDQHVSFWGNRVQDTGSSIPNNQTQCLIVWLFFILLRCLPSVESVCVIMSPYSHESVRHLLGIASFQPEPFGVCFPPLVDLLEV